VSPTPEAKNVHHEREDNATAVTIYGRTYYLRGNEDDNYLTGLASIVDRKMREVADATETADTLKVAILAAMNIADDYLQADRGDAPVVTGAEDRRVARMGHVDAFAPLYRQPVIAYIACSRGRECCGEGGLAPARRRGESKGARPLFNRARVKDELALSAQHQRPDLIQEEVLARRRGNTRAWMTSGQLAVRLNFEIGEAGKAHQITAVNTVECGPDLRAIYCPVIIGRGEGFLRLRGQHFANRSFSRRHAQPFDV